MKILLLLGLLHSALCACPEGQLEYWVTNPQDQYTNTEAGLAQGCLSPSSKINGQAPRAGTVEVDPTEQHQTVYGWGAALSNSAAYLIHYSSHREELLQLLFNTTSGIGVSFIRLPMAASDFMARGPAYTYDDTYDPELRNFSIEPELEFVIPTILAAKEVNPDLRILATPWSAPAWMKENNNIERGRFDSQFTDVYANYFVKFIQGFAEEGVHIDAITLQNEPLLEVPYASMILDEDAAINLTRSLGPKLVAAGLDTKIVVWDWNWDNPNYPIKVLNDSVARQYIDGFAMHGYSTWDPDDSQIVVDAFPDANYYVTEYSGFASNQNWPDVFSYMLGSYFIRQVQIGAVNGILWNLVLDENWGPTYEGGGCKDCRGVVTLYSDDSRIQKNIEYYIIGHMNKAASSGAVRIGSPEAFGDNNNLKSVAFQNPDDTIGIVVFNANPDLTEDVEVRVNGEIYNFEDLPPLGAVTFRT